LKNPIPRVFVPQSRGREGGAFGVFNRPISELRSDLCNAAELCRREAAWRTAPLATKSRFQRLRHLYAHILQLDVIFQPIKGWFPVREKDGSIHHKTCPVKLGKQLRCSCASKKTLCFQWADNPVWGRAPPGALKKARALCTVLNAVVLHGHLCNLVHDLERIAKMIWHMPMKAFRGLCRRIVAKIATSVKSRQTEVGRPEPSAGFGALTENPDIVFRVDWIRSRRRDCTSTYIPRYVPPHRRKRYASHACERIKDLIRSTWCDHE
jgi:hypothetical protein